MNYRHAFHAGNFADVLKHVVLARIVDYLNAKPAPWSYLDTHAGVGVYDLAGDEAERTGEWRNGVGRLVGRRLGAAAETLLAPWRAVLAEFQAPDGALARYPGSPEIVRRLARKDDRLRLCELHPKDRQSLAAALGRDERAKVVEIDGWTALGAWLPPRERRGLVLVDPPFEQPGELARMAERFLAAHRVWPTGVYALWYPVKDPAALRELTEPLIAAGVGKLLRVELLVREPSDPRLLSGSGLVIANPPWTLADELRSGLPDLAAALAQSAGARAAVETLAP
ncbi:23S rRNA (adenine(2030)-N(6))-methyltransferase RlmJ [Methylopila turkensis]|uniref:Ribosomal RNA large subunit methyltransferase J n=1 Tax=Methylopila turkensis TaxID=1437816 RepID=A0A9W6JJB8_9HYPH|nr:23S rRNA (adenine(2030)-N(6))-methyltransferase RlmJ [Methylopila turkensis]GLK78705.1 ribosomal RNA large subunit methyltransferase J [Methylopila turkensis]